MKDKKGLAQFVMIGVGVVLLAIAVGAVAFPIVQQVFNNSATSGTWNTSRSVIDGTIATYLPTFVLLTVLVGIVAIAILGALKR